MPQDHIGQEHNPFCLKSERLALKNASHISDAKKAKQRRRKPRPRKGLKLTNGGEKTEPSLFISIDGSYDPTTVTLNAPSKRPPKRHKLISMAQADNAADAYYFALRSGFPLNLAVALNWNLAPSDEPPFNRMARIRDAIKSWLHRRSLMTPIFWIECREKTALRGEHHHVLIHIPTRLRGEFARLLMLWVKGGAIDFDKGAVHIQSVRDFGALSYMLKASSHEVRKKYSVRSEWSSSQGTIGGPRLRVCHALGPKKRRVSAVE